MAMTNSERIAKALGLLRDGIRPKCEEVWKSFYGPGWLQAVNHQLHTPERKPNPGDVAFLFKGMKATWKDTYGRMLSNSVRALVFELSDVRNRWAHQHSFTTDDTIRALDSMERVLEAFGRPQHRRAIRNSRFDLMRVMFEEQSRSERRKTAARPTEGKPLAGLTPWREIITPHSDVASGRFEQAEFAADLSEVVAGNADPEYQDPHDFFARTYMTEGLRTLLVGAVRRLSGQGGDPVIELQTNFGGGKTHSLIALYHLTSGVSATELPGISETLAEAGLSLPPQVARSVLVGQMIQPAAPEEVEPGILLHTLWGRLAYQLGGRAGYEMVRADDEAGTNPGGTLKALFREFGPAVVLIDEWVAYARQLRDAGAAERLAGGDFDTQFTFAQALTETAAAAGNVVVLVSIPSSDVEVGGDRGREALQRLKNVVQRKAAQWQPASPDESFEIVRRRLFDPIPASRARVRDGVIRAFSEMYRNQSSEFRPAVSEADYRRRMELSYPIHPELFDRLFGDWSALDKFQRTRGVLRLMALAVSELWQRGDRSLLIMPSNLPMDTPSFVSEIKKYLEEGWDPIIKSDVDGPNALPLAIDKEIPRLGQLAAARRVARTIYMGSAPRPDTSRGVDTKSIVLGCAQPGEPVGRFRDALRRLSERATHLYVDGARYWYSLQPNVNRMAAERAEQNFTDFDADDLVRNRMVAERRRGLFSGVHVFPQGPGDVPDRDDGVRLVVIDPSSVHHPNDDNSPAITAAAELLAQRAAGPRFHRNLAVFLAASAPRREELRSAARMHLAWKSICEDAEILQLNPAQKRQADTKLAESEQTVASRIDETFIYILTPWQEAGQGELEWRTTRPARGGSLPERVTKKLKSEEKLVPAYSGVRVRMDLDKIPLWSDRGDIEVGGLWRAYTDFLYMPRLTSYKVLAQAVEEGVGNLNWAEETFAYAKARNDDTWVGVKSSELVTPARSGFILRPDVVPEVPKPPTPNGGPDGPKDGDGDGDDPGNGPPPPPPPPPPGPKTFYAGFDLDPVRGIYQLEKIMNEITNHLGEDVKLSLEIEADSTDGFDERIRRVVSENASNLGARSAEFE